MYGWVPNSKSWNGRFVCRTLKINGWRRIKLMSNKLKYIAENLDSLKIGLDETFKFNCTMCGKCCIDREDMYYMEFVGHHAC